MNNKKYFAATLLATSFLMLTGCETAQPESSGAAPASIQDSAPDHDVDVSKIPNAVPKALPKSKYGNPTSYSEFGKTYYVLKTAKGYNERGIASWYGTKFHNRRTSSGEPYNMYAMTAASPVLPIPCFVRVTNLANNRSVIVKVNDRGPFHDNRIIDLSYAAAIKLGYNDKGTALVQVTTISPKKAAHSPQLAKGKTPTSQPTIFVQVGAFGDKVNATDLEQKLQQVTSQHINITPEKSKQKTIYKVQIGPLNVASSDQVIHQVENAGLGKPITVIK